ncbi:Nif3-like dinuclear metal center hexameric protein [Halothiobacillus diazotrophicus]|uniref:Nif3-like dinuclear metal center hexameric protein n=1 Tax=Halothiobacillus diazotrophicus TaxID=1860122 RepID=A0A191ZKB1_9GAMM|nr:Nif3-like dinuclear metal center hexameric protein [Halothiobacillus diazotrophicus]
MHRSDLVAFCDDVLASSGSPDYAPNGLQVEGRERIAHIVTGVTACQELIDVAIDLRADAILVHHGFFWKNEPAPIVGMKYRRIAALIKHDINLIAYHLPLDRQPEFGNNAALADQLGLTERRLFGAQELAVAGTLPDSCTVDDLTARLTEVLGRPPLVVGPTNRPLRQIGLCTGGAQDYIGDAAALGLDAYISGEISERTTHVAREEGIVYFAAGHHATERDGVRLLGDRIASQFDVRVTFVDIDNPV